MPELLIVIVLLGILAAIAIPSWFGLIESRDVESAANQTVADMRLANSVATNRLGTAYIIFHTNNRVSGTRVTCNGVQADYCLVRPNGNGTNDVKARYLPDGAGLSRVGTSIPSNTAALPTGVSGSGNLISLQFSANGSVDTASTKITNANPRIRVGTDDNSPGYDIKLSPATSRVDFD